MKTRSSFKKIVIVLSIAIFAFVAMTVVANDVFAGDNCKKVDTCKTVKKEVKLSDKKGKFYYKKTCKSCHGKKGDGGELTPVSKTIKQWQRVFKKDKHYKKVKLSKDFDATQLKQIEFFLENHAADSDQPETCG